MMHFRPRNNLVLVEKIIEEKKGGIYVPENKNSIFKRFKILRTGTAESVLDLEKGDIVFAEDMCVLLDGNIGLLDQKYIHAVEEENGSN